MGPVEIIAMAGTIIAALCGAVAKLWLDNHALRSEAAREREKAQELEERINREHKRDLRWVLGMPTSLDPPPAAPLIRDERRGPPRPRKKPTP